MRIQIRVEEYRLRCGMTNAVWAIITGICNLWLKNTENKFCYKAHSQNLVERKWLPLKRLHEKENEWGKEKSTGL